MPLDLGIGPGKIWQHILGISNFGTEYGCLNSHSRPLFPDQVGFILAAESASYPFPA